MSPAGPPPMIATCFVMVPDYVSSILFAIGAAGRGHDGDRLAGFQDRLAATAEVFVPAVEAMHDGFAEFSVPAACKSVRPDRPVRGEDGAIHLLQEADRPFRAVAGRPLATATGTFADVEILQQHRKAGLKDLRGGGARRIGRAKV